LNREAFEFGRAAKHPKKMTYGAVKVLVAHIRGEEVLQK
jgi:hypothetical protein